MWLCPLQHIPMHTKFMNTSILEGYKIFPVLGRGWDHDWDHCPVAAVAMQEVAPGAKPLGQEEHYLQVKSCISQHPESLDCTSLLPGAISRPHNYREMFSVVCVRRTTE